MSHAGQSMVPACFMVPEDTLSTIIEIVKRFGGHPTIDGATGNNEWFPAASLEENSKPGTLLRGARLRAEMTQNELANLVGIPQSHISQMENGRRVISAEKAALFAKILGTSSEHFLK